MKLVAGLGNPGADYRGTRHNVGFDVIDVLARRHGVGFEAAPVQAVLAKWRPASAQGYGGQAAREPVLFVKPLTFMNLSGEAVAGLCRYYKIETPDVLIVCDDVNLPVGRLRARGTGTEGGHNGLRSIAQHLGTIDYARLRIGVGRGSTERDLADHVLSRFAPEEQSGVEDAITRAADAVDLWIDDGLAKMMNIFNRDVDK